MLTTVMRRLAERLRQALSARLWLGTCLAALGCLGAFNVHAQDFADHALAAERFQALRRAEPAAMPSLTQPKVVKVLTTLADIERFLPQPVTAELPALSVACDRVRDVSLAYQAFEALQEGQLSPQRLLANAHTYQAELSLLQPFLAHCIERQIPLAEAVLQQISPALRPQLRMGGLRRGQSSVLQLYASLATSSDHPRIARESIQPLLLALADTAQVHVRALSLQDRAGLHQLAQDRMNGVQRDQSVPRKQRQESTDAWARIARAMQSTRCEALCALASNARPR